MATILPVNNKGAHSKRAERGLKGFGVKPQNGQLAPGETPKKESPIVAQLAKLSTRERALLLGLFGVVIIVVFFVYVFMPNMDALAEKEVTLAELQAQQREEQIALSQAIAKSAAAKEAMATAQAQRDAYARLYFTPL
jgi:type II secretory pathway component PulM